VGTTEALDPVTATSQLDDNLSDADRVVLKKAYRKAVATAHPDKGGSVADFQAVQEAYLAGDLASLNEYFLLAEGSLHQKIGYWLQQPIAAHVDWVRFQATNEYKIVGMYQRGEHERAVHIAGQILDVALSIAEQEEMDLLLSIGGFGITVNKHYGGSV
jgi:hypothetical protein